MEERKYGRGVFLATVAAGVSSLAWGRSAWSHVSSALGGAEAFVPLVPGGGWRIYTVADHMPVFDPETWQLRVGGLVQEPLTLDYGALRALPRTNQVRTFHCVTGWTVQDVHWSGVHLTDLFDRVKPLPEAGAVQFVSAEVPYVDYLALRQASLADVMLAYEMNGKPLPQEHGSPIRLVIPEMYGYKNVKWVSEIRLVRQPEDGYWEQLGYDRDAWVGRSNGYSS